MESKPIQNENLSKSELVAASALHSGSFLDFTAIKADTGQIYYTALEWSEVDDMNKNSWGSFFFLKILFLFN